MKTQYTTARFHEVIRLLATSNHPTSENYLLREILAILSQEPALPPLTPYFYQKLSTALFGLLGSPSHSGYVAKYRLLAIEIMGKIGDEVMKHVLEERLRNEWEGEICDALWSAIHAIEDRLKA